METFMKNISKVFLTGMILLSASFSYGNQGCKIFSAEYEAKKSLRFDDHDSVVIQKTLKKGLERKGYNLVGDLAQANLSVNFSFERHELNAGGVSVKGTVTVTDLSTEERSEEHT